ncbi:hypothetical protein LTR84_013050 [Exophiala bonariae]|uniref:Uncharacterized protein n=1 Tax=Exophiala bonariae TaxID=1690606 RepID=A0AAV9NG82_9EURO|nr:hypothetical protein LTR84_013050 [Exophiala bonariae]
MIACETPVTTGQRESETALWECLNSDQILDEPDALLDLIGVLNPQGCEIHAIARGPTPPGSSCTYTTDYDFQVKEQVLDEGNIHQWLENNAIETQVESTLKLKVLLVDQVVFHDRLRPPAEAEAVRFSRKVLCSGTGCSPAALERVCRNESSIWEFPRDRRNGTRIDCRGFGEPNVGVVWMNKAGCDTVWALIRFHTARAPMRASITRELHNLRGFSDLPGFLAFIILNAATQNLQMMMDFSMTSIDRSGLKLTRFPDSETAAEVYGSLIASGRNLAIRQNATKMKLKMVKQCRQMPAPANARHDLRLRNTFSSLKRAFRYLEQVLESISGTGEEYQGHTGRQLECVLSIMAQRQQELSIDIARGQSKLAEASRREQVLSIEIARASHSIAKQTKKDGASMKTLAVVTLVYLPCTTVSSVLAMPLFDWNAEGRSIVNSRIWVFFVFAVPLTVLTLGIWRVWLSYRAREEDKALESEAEDIEVQSSSSS